jgi:hypothetical protein
MPGQRLATEPELNLMCIEVTKCAELKERRMISDNESKGFFSSEICPFALSQEVHHSEASIAAHDKGECVSGVPGSQAVSKEIGNETSQFSQTDGLVGNGFGTSGK